MTSEKRLVDLLLTTFASLEKMSSTAIAEGLSTASDKLPSLGWMQDQLQLPSEKIFDEELSNAIGQTEKAAGYREYRELYAAAHAAELVQRLTATQRKAVRQAILDAIKENKSIPQLARDVRESIGLLPRQQRSLNLYRIKLLQEGKLPQAAEKEVEKRRQKMLTQRARMIARTEISYARNVGLFTKWTEQVDDGMLERRVKKIWVTKDPCPICQELGMSKPIPLKQQFFSLSARQRWLHPPAHPNCKCVIALVR